ncbi:16S rRNA (cytosine(967)-C(5))-methyltransferase RsmB [Coralloluteibacterium thermophilus]|uniref:16S rRNA (cytosine(967)-C(5))-methyltransferase n=1 Tax=Coralloluteibacterium thermophilum TaxID=2707049 RepID=A0ABV9NE53_9GAMM
MKPGVAARALAARILAAVLDGRSLKAELAARLGTLPDPRDRAFVEALCFEALRRRRRYDFALSRWMARPLARSDAEVHALLLVGLTQLDALQLAAHGAIGATAEAARALDRPRHVGLVNALLRRATREPLPHNDDPAVASSHPDWLVAALRADWPEDWRAILDANLQPAPAWLRVNTRVQSRTAYVGRLAEAGIEHALPEAPAEAVVLAGSIAPQRLPGWEAGAVSLQDGAAQLVADALAPRAGERVLDACAAPGGKAAHLLERADIALTALDVDPQRLLRIGETLERLGLAGRADLRAADAAEPATWWDGVPFDVVLLDAPCSGTGVVRRQPDILAHRRQGDIEALAGAQARLLDALWPTLRPGGRLLYSTCSILRRENARQVEAFLGRTPDARALPLDDRFGRIDGRGRQRLPGVDGMDGFFYALLEKGGRE